MILLLFYYVLSKDVDLEVFAKKVPVDLAGFDAKENEMCLKKQKD